MDVFIAQLMKLVKSIVVKRDEFAAETETVDSKRDADRYIAMIESGTNWYSFSEFDIDVLRQAGMNEDLIKLVLDNGKEYIPQEFRQLVCEYQKINTITNYVEKNDYYRMLNGQPKYRKDHVDILSIEINRDFGNIYVYLTEEDIFFGLNDLANNFNVDEAIVEEAVSPLRDSNDTIKIISNGKYVYLVSEKVLYNVIDNLGIDTIKINNFKKWIVELMLMYKDDWVFMPSNIYNIPTAIPIHKLSDGNLQYINTSSYRSELINAYPDIQYLKYLGNRSIDYYHARVARNYDILFYERSDNDNISNAFIKAYASARNYVMIGLYNKPDQKLYEHYDSFMGFLVVVVAIQKLFHAIFKQGISRDFFDTELIKDLFDAYNFPYITTIDLKYQKEIAKKLNLLLQKKATNNVLFDIVSLFDFPSVNIYKYYLVRDYHKDTKGNPIIIHKTIFDEYGEEHQVIDYEKTFDLYFTKVNIKSKDVSSDISNKSNRVPYEAITGGDPYWLNDTALFNKIYTKKFNQILTKYMSIDVSYELAKLLYETSHGLRMMIDDNDDYKKIYIKISGVVEPVSLYDTVIFLCALMARKFGLKGNIPVKGYQIAQVYGFNFKTDMDMLKSKILEDIESCTGEYKKVKEETLKYLNTLNATTLEGAVKMYADIEALRVFLDNSMRYATDIDEYVAYWKLYQSTLIVEDTKELYTKNDGSYASTFLELLADRRPDLYAIVYNIGRDDSGKIITDLSQDDLFQIDHMSNSILDRLSQISYRFSELRYANDKSEIVSNIEKVINQLKSYTVSQTASSIVYLIRDPHLCLLKFICDLITACKESINKDLLFVVQSAILHYIEIRDVKNESYRFGNEMFYEKMEVIDTLFKTLNKIAYEYKVYDPVSDKADFFDTIHNYFERVIVPYHQFYLQHDLYARLDHFPKDGICFHSEEMFSTFIKSFNEGKITTLDNIDNEKVMVYLALLNMVGECIVDVKRSYFEALHFSHNMLDKEKLSYLAMNLFTYEVMLRNAIRPIDMPINTKEDLFRTFMRYEYRDLYVLDWLITFVHDTLPKDKILLYNMITLGMANVSIEEKKRLANEMFSVIDQDPIKEKVNLITFLFMIVNQRFADRNLNRVLVYDILFPIKSDNRINVKLPVIEEFIEMITSKPAELVHFNEYLMSYVRSIDVTHLLGVYNTIDSYTQYLISTEIVNNEENLIKVTQWFDQEKLDLIHEVFNEEKDNITNDRTYVLDGLCKYISSYRPFVEKLIRDDHLASSISMYGIHRNINLVYSAYLVSKQNAVRELSRLVDTFITHSDYDINHTLSVNSHFIQNIGYKIKENLIADLRLAAMEKKSTIKHLSNFYNILSISSKDTALLAYKFIESYLDIFKTYRIYVDEKLLVNSQETKDGWLDMPVYIRNIINNIRNDRYDTFTDFTEDIDNSKEVLENQQLDIEFNINDEKDEILGNNTTVNDIIVLLKNKDPMKDFIVRDDSYDSNIYDIITQGLTNFEYRLKRSRDETYMTDLVNTFSILILDNTSFLNDTINFSVRQLIDKFTQRVVGSDVSFKSNFISEKALLLMIGQQTTTVIIKNEDVRIGESKVLDTTTDTYKTTVRETEYSFGDNKSDGNKSFFGYDLTEVFDSIILRRDNDPRFDVNNFVTEVTENKIPVKDTSFKSYQTIEQVSMLKPFTDTSPVFYDAIVLANMDRVCEKFNLSKGEAINIIATKIRESEYKSQLLEAARNKSCVFSISDNLTDTIIATTNDIVSENDIIVEEADILSTRVREVGYQSEMKENSMHKDSTISTNNILFGLLPNAERIEFVPEDIVQHTEIDIAMVQNDKDKIRMYMEEFGAASTVMFSIANIFSTVMYAEKNNYITIDDISTSSLLTNTVFTIIDSFLKQSEVIQGKTEKARIKSLVTITDSIDNCISCKTHTSMQFSDKLLKLEETND